MCRDVELVAAKALLRNAASLVREALTWIEGYEEAWELVAEAYGLLMRAYYEIDKPLGELTGHNKTVREIIRSELAPG